MQKSHGAHRYQKSDVMKVSADFKNNSINRLQFYTFCFEKDLEAAHALLQSAVEQKIIELDRLHKLSKQVFEEGPQI